jgi:hypothetical protein
MKAGRLSAVLSASHELIELQPDRESPVSIRATIRQALYMNKTAEDLRGCSDYHDKRGLAQIRSRQSEPANNRGLNKYIPFCNGLCSYFSVVRIQFWPNELKIVAHSQQQGGNKPINASTALTSREAEDIRNYTLGFTNQEIAAQSDVSSKTAKRKSAQHSEATVF